MATTLIARADREGDLWHLTLPLTVGAMIDAARGATAVAIDLARRAVRVAERLGCPADVFDALESMVIVLLETEKPGEAVGLARRIGALFREGIESRPDQARPFVAAGEAFLEAGDTVGARAMAEQARALVHDCVWGVSVDRLESEIRLRLRDREGALRRIGRWLDEPSPVVFEQARVHEVAARALFLLGERDAGARQADEAIGFYRRIGVRPRLERFERIVRKYRPRKPGRPRSELPGGLTPRELEVLRLVLQGLTNRQIADVLTVSALTVKKHVENLLAKAKVRRRAELLEFATRAGVTFEPFVAPKQA
jgi:DNA-binding CsgD family transcriptional regulator